MEIKATLNKPYTEKQRANFIVANNHELGYEIKETETALEAWGCTEEEKQQQEKQQLILEIKQQLNNLDLKSIRALRSNDTEYIELYEQQAVELRNRLKELQRKEDEE